MYIFFSIITAFWCKVFTFLYTCTYTFSQHYRSIPCLQSTSFFKYSRKQKGTVKNMQNILKFQPGWFYLQSDENVELIIWRDTIKRLSLTTQTEVSDMYLSSSVFTQYLCITENSRYLKMQLVFKEIVICASSLKILH